MITMMISMIVTKLLQWRSMVSADGEITAEEWATLDDVFGDEIAQVSGYRISISVKKDPSALGRPNIE